MNFKTTIGLGIAVVALSAIYLIMGVDRAAQSRDAAGVDGAPSSASNAATEPGDGRSLSKPPLDDDSQIVEVAYERRGKPRMVFQLVDRKEESGPERWMMVEPTRCLASSWTVSDIALAAKRLEYASEYRISGPGGVSLEDAGIRPEPTARFTVTSKDGAALEFEVGDTLIGQRKRYVFLPARPDKVFVAEEDFKAILDREPTQYREKNLFRLTTADAVALKVTARGEDGTTTYELTKQNNEWLFVAPFKAEADSKKINQVISGLNNLWASSWVEDVPESLAEFGLDDPYLRVSVTTEKVIEKPKAEPVDGDESPGDEQAESEEGQTAQPEDEPAPEKEIKRNQFVLLLSNRKPIDDDKKIYFKRAEDEQVGTVASEKLDTFAPDETQWRNMKIMSKSKAASANSMTICLPNQTIEFELRGNDWYFSGTEELVEPVEVAGLLAGFDLLKAVSFVDPGAQPSFGLEPPAAEVTLSFPDSADVETLRLGAFTEAVEKRLRYAQRVGTSTVAKVKAKDVDKVFRGRVLYRNREILNYDQSRLLKVELTRALPASGLAQTLTLSRDENKVWQMTVPAQAEVDLEPVNEMAKTLANLRGKSIVDEPNPDKLGLSNPDIQVTVTVEGVPTIKVSDFEEGDSAETEHIPGEPIIRRVNLSKRDGRVYAHHLAQAVFMEVDEAVYDALMAEVLDGQFWDFEQSQVVAFGSKDENREVSFRKVRDRWQYSVEPDIPIDPKKVEQHVSKLRNLKTARFVEYSATNLSSYGLNSPTHRFFFEVEDGTVQELLISGAEYRGDGQGVYATVRGSNRIFVLQPSVLNLGVIKLERLEADE